MLNGAVTLGTMDGANVEICEAVGDNNIFIFGQREDEVRNNLKYGYNAADYYNSNEILRNVVDAIGYGFNGKDFKEIKRYLLEPSYSIADPYMCMLDFEDYLRVHDEMAKAYEDRTRWNTMSADNIAKASRFAADRSIDEYAKFIWHTKPVF
jgi:starch phosphorylase